MNDLLRYGLIFAAWTTGMLLLIVGWRRWTAAARAKERFDDTLSDVQIQEIAASDEPGLLRRWLIHAGFRSRTASGLFLLSHLAATGLGIIAAGIVFWTDVGSLMLSGLSIVPGGFGDLFLPAVYIAPWFALVLFSSLPMLFVRQRRQLRVEQIEQDLPIALDLMATLSEAGLGFDATLSRLFQTRLSRRPLGQEFRTFQADLLAGRSRVQSLRRLSRRAEVASITLLVSSMVQAEHLGMGLADVLRRMADDLRDRRRERANAFAASLPVKLMLPLMTCFLPGVFVWTLGPIFSHFIKLADSVIQSGTL
ncbi:MAG: type II secretion system F family protein [Planctomycetota bacterium]|nr:type II secretion system F family protein [Planctomycetota bacterium]